MNLWRVNSKSSIGSEHHLFHVHSGITEIVASRTIARLRRNNQVVPGRIVVVTSRSYRAVMLGEYRQLQYVSPGSDPDRLFSHRRPRAPFFLKNLMYVRSLIDGLGIAFYRYYTPHTKMLMAHAFITHPACIGYHIIEEGNLSFMSRAEIRAQKLFPPNACQGNRPLRRALVATKSFLLTVVLFLQMLGFGARCFASYCLCNFDAASGWYLFNSEKFSSFVAVTSRAFEDWRDFPRHVLEEVTCEERAAIAGARTKFNSYKEKSLLLVPSPTSRDAAQQAQEFLSIVGESPTSDKILLRLHPNEQALSPHEVLSSMGLHYDDSRMVHDPDLDKEPLEILSFALNLRVLNAGVSSYFRYTRLYCGMPQE